TRQIVTNSRRKLTLSRFGAEVLTGLGVPAERCAVIPPGCSPASAGGPRTGGRWRKHGYVFLAVADSSDPDRCRTDSLLDAFGRAFQADDRVVLLLQDRAEASSARQLRRWSRGPRVEIVPGSADPGSLAPLFRSADCFVTACGVG